MWTFGFHLEFIQLLSAYSIGHIPINLPINALSLINCILSLIRWLGKSSFGLWVATGLHVEELALVLSLWSWSLSCCLLLFIFSSVCLSSLSVSSNRCFWLSFFGGGASPSPWGGCMFLRTMAGQQDLRSAQVLSRLSYVSGACRSKGCKNPRMSCRNPSWASPLAEHVKML